MTAIVPLTTYTLLILFRNFAAGFSSVPAEILEAAEGMGYTRRQRLFRVELPLSVPLIIAGIRLASVTTIGLATIAAVLGDTFGGLGQLITEGIQTFFPTKYLLGAALSVVLAFAADFLFVRIEHVDHAVGPRQGRGPLMDVLSFFGDPTHWEGTNGIPARLLEHLVTSGLSILVATLIAVPVGLYIGHTNRGSGFAINLANIGRAIPSYAMMVIPLPLTITLAPVLGFDPNFGLVFLPTFLAMTFLAIPPLLVATYAGLRSVDRDLIEAGRGMGLRDRQILGQIEIPIASSIIVGGFRTATLQVIATATIGAILGGGGLGRFIFDGLNQGPAGRPSIFAGAILVSGLAIGVDALLALIQTRLTPHALRKGRRNEPRRAMTGLENTVPKSPVPGR